jgi:hypothetical protein
MALGTVSKLDEQMHSFLAELVSRIAMEVFR